MDIRSMLFVLCCVVTVVTIFVVLLMSPRPRCMRSHLQGLGRFLVLVGCAFGAAGVLSGGSPPPWYAVVIVCGIGNLAAQVLAERWRHGREKEREDAHVRESCA